MINTQAEFDAVLFIKNTLGFVDEHGCSPEAAMLAAVALTRTCPFAQALDLAKVVDTRDEAKIAAHVLKYGGTEAQAATVAKQYAVGPEQLLYRSLQTRPYDLQVLCIAVGMMLANEKFDDPLYTKVSSAMCLAQAKFDY